jgi:DNA-binding MarR family transcriptional regulator
VAKAKTPAGEGGPASFQEMPGHLLRRCQQIAVSIFLKECRACDLTPLQFAALSALAEHGALDQAHLGGISALDRTTVSVIVRKLESRALVTRARNRADRRSKLISITAKGRALLRRVLPRVQAAQDRILAPLNDRERAQFTALMRKVADANNLESRAPYRLAD